MSGGTAGPRTTCPGDFWSQGTAGPPTPVSFFTLDSRAGLVNPSTDEVSLNNIIIQLEFVSL